MTENIKKGMEAEELAVDFLQRKGFTVIERNLRHGHHEIDLIVQKGNWLIFAEVKMRTSVRFGPPEISVTWKKRKNLRSAARWYIFKRNWKGNVRFDVVAVTVLGDKTDILHIEDAFG
ncbi:MAG: YraN family protein [Bacteroidota bacterium]